MCSTTKCSRWIFPKMYNPPSKISVCISSLNGCLQYPTTAPPATMLHFLGLKINHLFAPLLLLPHRIAYVSVELIFHFCKSVSFGQASSTTSLGQPTPLIQASSVIYIFSGLTRQLNLSLNVKVQVYSTTINVVPTKPCTIKARLSILCPNALKIKKRKKTLV